MTRRSWNRLSGCSLTSKVQGSLVAYTVLKPLDAVWWIGGTFLQLLPSGTDLLSSFQTFPNYYFISEGNRDTAKWHTFLGNPGRQPFPTRDHSGLHLCLSEGQHVPGFPGWRNISIRGVAVLVLSLCPCKTVWYSKFSQWPKVDICRVLLRTLSWRVTRICANITHGDWLIWSLTATVWRWTLRPCSNGKLQLGFPHERQEFEYLGHYLLPCSSINSSWDSNWHSNMAHRHPKK